MKKGDKSPQSKVIGSPATSGDLPRQMGVAVERFDAHVFE
jgi:hypothetical protein